MRLLADLTPLRTSAAYRRLYAATFVSVTGNVVTDVAAAVQVYALTHSSISVGLVGLADGLPLLILGLLGGSIADAVDRRRLVLATSTGLTLTSAALAVQAAAHNSHAGPIYALVAVSSALSALQSPASSSFAARLVPADQLGAVAALRSLSFQAALVLGPLIAGLLVATSGYTGAYAVDAASFLASLAAVARLPAMPPLGPATRAGLSSIAEGLRFVRRTPVIMAVLVADLDATILGFPKALFPALADTRLGGGAGTVGLMYAAMAVGGVAVSVLSRPVAHARRPGRIMLAAVILAGLAFAGAALATTLAVALPLLAVAGLGDAANGIVRTGLLQSLTPDELRGRVQSIGQIVGRGGPSLGDVVSGGAGSLTTPVIGAVGGGLASVLGVAVLALAVPSLLRYETPPD